MTTLHFLSDWSQQSGEIHAGEPLRIEYDPQRLPEHRAERYGQRAWNITAYFRFHPGGQAQARDVSIGAAEISVPAGTRQIELWFYNSDHTGGSAWDSCYGQNYWLGVATR